MYAFNVRNLSFYRSELADELQRYGGMLGKVKPFISKYIGAALILMAVAKPVTSSAEVTPAKFRQSTANHVNRLCDGMVAAYRAHRDYFIHLDESLVRAYCTLHDLPKPMSLRQLKRFGYSLNEDIATILARFDGKSQYPRQVDGVTVHDMNDSELKYFRTAVSELNRIEDAIKAYFLAVYQAEYELDARAIRHVAVELYFLEYPVDITDTRIYRRKELKIEEPPEPYNSAYWIADREKPPLISEISRFIEDRTLGHNNVVSYINPHVRYDGRLQKVVDATESFIETNNMNSYTKVSPPPKSVLEHRCIRLLKN